MEVGWSGRVWIDSENKGEGVKRLWFIVSMYGEGGSGREVEKHGLVKGVGG